MTATHHHVYPDGTRGPETLPCDLEPVVFGLERVLAILEAALQEARP